MSTLIMILIDMKLGELDQFCEDTTPPSKMQRQDNLHSRLSSIRLSWRQGSVKSPHPDKQPWRNPLARFPPVSKKRLEQEAVYESPAESSKKKWLKDEDDMKSLGEKSFSSSNSR